MGRAFVAGAVSGADRISGDAILSTCGRERISSALALCGLLLPWLFWSAFFRLVDLKVSDSPDKWQVLHDPLTLFVGSAIHLWFLPFIMLAMLLVKPVGRFVTSPVRLAWVLFGACADFGADVLGDALLRTARAVPAVAVFAAGLYAGPAGGRGASDGACGLAGDRRVRRWLSERFL